MGREWRGGSSVFGPFSLEQMRDAFKKGDINENTQIRYGLKSPWLPLKEVAFFSNLVSGPRFRFGKFWKRYKTLSIITAAVLLIFFYVRLQAPASVKFVTPVLHQEVLNRTAIISLTNEARTSKGLSPLNENPLLNAVAEKRAQDMLEKQYFAHVSPFGEQASDIAQRIGYRYRIIAENIGSGRFVTNQKIIDGWMQSPGHRKNILSTDVEDLGAAIIKGNMNGEETWIAVQIFGLQSPEVSQATCVVPSQTLLQEIQIKKTELLDLRDRLTRLKQDLDNEHASIETDRRLSSRSQRDTNDLNLKIKVYNERSNLHNRYLADMKAKSIVLQSMINEYDEMLQTYNDCRSIQ